MFSSPPSSVFLWRHVNNWNYVSNLKPEKKHNVLSDKVKRQYKTLRWKKRHLERELICSLGNIALYYMSSSNSWNIYGGLIMDQQAVSFIINLNETNRGEIQTEGSDEYSVIKSSNLVAQEQIQTLLPSKWIGIQVGWSGNAIVVEAEFWQCGKKLDFDHGGALSSGLTSTDPELRILSLGFPLFWVF